MVVDSSQPHRLRRKRGTRRHEGHQHAGRRRYGHRCKRSAERKNVRLIEPLQNRMTVAVCGRFAGDVRAVGLRAQLRRQPQIGLIVCRPRLAAVPPPCGADAMPAARRRTDPRARSPDGHHPTRRRDSSRQTRLCPPPRFANARTAAICAIGHRAQVRQNQRAQSVEAPLEIIRMNEQKRYTCAGQRLHEPALGLAHQQLRVVASEEVVIALRIHDAHASRPAPVGRDRSRA